MSSIKDLWVIRKIIALVSKLIYNEEFFVGRGVLNSLMFFKKETYLGHRNPY